MVEFTSLMENHLTGCFEKIYKCRIMCLEISSVSTKAGNDGYSDISPTNKMKKEEAIENIYINKLSEMKQNERTLEEQRKEFTNRKFLATPLAGLIIWLIIGIAGLVLPVRTTVWVLFIGTGSIVYLGLFISKFTGENFLDKNKPKNEFDKLFFFTVGQAVLVYAIAIPFFIIDFSSLPLTIGILTGLMWLPFSWIIKHWVGIFHTMVRTVSILVLWYLFPEYRFVLIPFVIVLIYIVTIVILIKRKRV